MAKVIGLFPKSFKTDDGKEIKGFDVFYTSAGKDESEHGVRSYKDFVSQQRYDDNPFGLGDNIVINYNKWGKVASVEIL